MTFEEFVATYEAKLGEWTSVTLAFAPRHLHPGRPKVAADSLVQSLHFSPLGEGWIDLEWDIRKHANPYYGDHAGHLTQRLRSHIISGGEWFTTDEARKLATDFYGMFSREQTAYLVNMILHVARKSGVTAYSGNSITQFPGSSDWAYIAMDDDKIGMLFLEAYD